VEPNDRSITQALRGQVCRPVFDSRAAGGAAAGALPPGRWRRAAAPARSGFLPAVRDASTTHGSGPRRGRTALGRSETTRQTARIPRLRHVSRTNDRKSGPPGRDDDPGSCHIAAARRRRAADAAAAGLL